MNRDIILVIILVLGIFLLNRESLLSEWKKKDKKEKEKDKETEEIEV